MIINEILNYSIEKKLQIDEIYRERYKTAKLLYMFQRQFLLRYQVPYQRDSQILNLHKKVAKYSPKVQNYSSPRKNGGNNEIQSKKYQYYPNVKASNDPYEQSSESYSQYYQQRENVTNSISAGSLHPSKYKRTQNSLNKIRHLQQIRQEQQNMMRLKQKYSQVSNSSGPISNEKVLNQHLSREKANKILISGQQQSYGNRNTDKIETGKSNSLKGRHLRTQLSKQKSSKHNSKGHHPQTSRNPVQTSNTQNNNTHTLNNNTYSQSIQNSLGARNYHNQSRKKLHRHQNTISPSQEYYSTSNRQEISRQIQRSNRLRRNLLPNSNNASTVNTQNRPSSLTLDKFSNKKMITFYQCDANQIYRYNDEGYLTDREILLREKVQKSAEEALDRIIIEQEEQSQSSKIRKSKSLGHFPKLNRLMQEAEKQRKRKYQLYGKYQNNQSIQNTESKSKGTLQMSKQRSYNPSQLPPSSSLSKKKFNVTYKEEQSQNILTQNHINDDSYYEREARKTVESGQSIDENIRCRKIQKGRKNMTITPIKIKNKVQFQNSVSSAQQDQSHNINMQANQLSPKVLSGIGGITSEQMISSNSNIQKIIFEEKQSNLEDLSQSSISEEASHSQSSYSQSLSKGSKKSNMIQRKGINQDSKSEVNYDLEMINSNYKKVTLTDREQRDHGNEQNQSLKLKTNTSKIRKQSKLEPHKVRINHKASSQTSQQNFDENNEFLIKETQKSVKSSHIGLKKQLSKQKSSKNSKSGIYESESAIQTPLSKKQPVKKWVRQDSSIHDQHLKQGQVNMKKNKSKKSEIQNANGVQQNSENQQLRMDSFRKVQKINRFSIQSFSLKLDSGINLQNKSSEKYLKSASSKISYKNQSKLTSKKQYSGEDDSYGNPSQARSIQNNKKRYSAAKQSYDLKLSANLEESKAKKSRLSVQREEFKSKTCSRKSSNVSSKKIMVQKCLNPGKNSQSQGAKFGTLLRVQNSKGSALQKFQSESLLGDNRSIKHKSKSQKSKRQPSQSGSVSQFQSQSSFQSSVQFNLIERAENLLDIEDDLHQKRKMLEEEEQMTEQFDELLAKIQSHIYMLRQILQISTTAIDIYPADSKWIYSSCLLSLKKYHLQRAKVVDSLRGKRSCFKIAQNQLEQQNLKQFLTHQEIILLAKHMQFTNQLTQKLIEDFMAYVFHCLGSQFSENKLNLRPFDDRYDLGILLEEYRTQILSLRDKNSSEQEISRSNHSEQEVIQQDTKEIINKRIFKLMQVGFLLSQLAGKRIKEFTEQIDINQEFQEYFQDQWPHFQRIVKTFS